MRTWKDATEPVIAAAVVCRSCCTACIAGKKLWQYNTAEHSMTWRTSGSLLIAGSLRSLQKLLHKPKEHVTNANTCCGAWLPALLLCKTDSRSCFTGIDSWGQRPLLNCPAAAVCSLAGNPAAAR